MKKVLIVGGASLAGTGLLKCYFDDSALNKNFKVDVSIRNAWDCPFPVAPIVTNIQDKQEVRDLLLKVKPDVIIFLVAEGNVDVCEKNQEHAQSVNVEALHNFIGALKEIDRKAFFIYVSSNAVFDGKSPPYDEESTPNPINFYGKTKLQAEMIVREMLPDAYAIVRPILILGMSVQGRRQSFIEIYMDKLLKGEQLAAVDDVFCNPIHTNYLADGIWKIIQQIDKNFEVVKNSVFHFAGKESLSRYDLLLGLAEFFGFDKNLIVRVQSDSFPSLAERPRDTTYRTNKAQLLLNWKAPSFSETLELIKREFQSRMTS